MIILHGGTEVSFKTNTFLKQGWNLAVARFASGNLKCSYDKKYINLNSAWCKVTLWFNQSLSKDNLVWLRLAIKHYQTLKKTFKDQNCTFQCKFLLERQDHSGNIKVSKTPKCFGLPFKLFLSNFFYFLFVKLHRNTYMYKHRTE